MLKHTVLELNTLGDIASRNAYRAALVDYYRDKVEGLSEDSRAGSSSIRCASSIRRTRVTSASTPARRLSPSIYKEASGFLRRGVQRPHALGIA